MLGVYFSTKNITLKARELLKKRIPITFFVGLVVVILMPYILKYLTRGNIVLEPPPDNRVLGIKKLVSDVKSELYELEKDRIEKQEASLFEVTGFDLEISFVAKAGSQQKSGVEYQIVTADSEIQYGIEKIQKLTLHMKTSEDKEPKHYPGSQWPSTIEHEDKSGIGNPSR